MAAKRRKASINSVGGVASKARQRKWRQRNINNIVIMTAALMAAAA